MDQKGDDLSVDFNALIGSRGMTTNDRNGVGLERDEKILTFSENAVGHVILYKISHIFENKHL